MTTKHVRWPVPFGVSISIPRLWLEEQNRLAQQEGYTRLVVHLGDYERAPTLEHDLPGTPVQEGL